MPCLKGVGGEVEFSAFEQVLARSAVRLAVAQGISFPKLPGNWKPVIALCPMILKEPDLRIIQIFLHLRWMN